MKKLLLIFFLASSVLIASDVWFGDIAENHLWLSDRPSNEIPCQMQNGHAVWVRTSDWAGDPEPFNRVTVFDPTRQKKKSEPEQKTSEKNIYEIPRLEYPISHKKTGFPDTETRVISERIISTKYPSDLEKTVFVSSYTRDNGTQVASHMRSLPGTKTYPRKKKK